MYQNLIEGNKLTSARISALGSMIQNMAWNVSRSLKICTHLKDIFLKDCWLEDYKAVHDESHSY